jgi:hypothetical protein
LWQCRRTCDPLLMSPFACSSLSWSWFLVGVQGGKKGRIVQVGGGVEGGCSVAGSAAAAAFAAAASPCAERWMWPCTLSVAVCCLCTRSEPKPTTTLSFPVHRLACTRQGKETTSTLLQARCDVGTGHTSLPPCRWNSRRRPTEHNHDRRELGGNLPFRFRGLFGGAKQVLGGKSRLLLRPLAVGKGAAPSRTLGAGSI